MKENAVTPKPNKTGQPNKITQKNPDNKLDVFSESDNLPLELSSIQRIFEHKGKRIDSELKNLTSQNIIALQHTLGNQKVQRLIAQHKAINSTSARKNNSDIQTSINRKPLASIQPQNSDKSNKEILQSKNLDKVKNKIIGSQPNNVIQRTYAALSPMGKARVDQQSSEKYRKKAEQYELGMAPIIMSDAGVNGVVDDMLARVNQIVTAWSTATGRNLADTYTREFNWAGGDSYYGAFLMTSAKIQDIFSNATNYPMRSKLKLVYNAVRNNNLSKWLQIAALQLDEAAKGKTPQDVKIKTKAGAVMNGGKVIKNTADKETVNSQFATNSGLNNWLTPQQVTQFAQTANQEKTTDKFSSKRNVYGHDRFSNVMGWKAETVKANNERTPNANKGLTIDEQRTLTVANVPDLSSAEIKLLHQRRNNTLNTPNKTDRANFRGTPANKIEWSQGGEFYDVNLDSDSARTAADFQARMEAGISGSTDLMLHAMENLGYKTDANKMKGMRLALAGWMLANRDHSFYEVYKAAESYGVPFDIDRNDPGKEYESAQNLAPMQPTDFQTILPHNRFPKYYLSTIYKNALSNALPESGKDKTAFNNNLIANGIPAATANGLNNRQAAEAARLAEIVQNQEINQGARMALKTQALRRIKQSNSFIYLATNLGLNPATEILNALLKKYHGGKGLLYKPNDKVNSLADAGIPRVIMNGLPSKTINKLEELRGKIQSAKVNPANQQLDLTQVNKTLAGIKLGGNKNAVVLAVLIKTYHGTSKLTDPQKLHANAAQMLAGHEENGVKKMSTAELNALQTPTPSDGPQLNGANYWGTTAARNKLVANLDHVVKGDLQAIANDPGRKNVFQPKFNAQILNNDNNNINAFQADVTQDGWVDAVIAWASVVNANFLETEVLSESKQKALTGLRNLHDKEVGAIFQYTSAMYKPIVNSSNSFDTKAFNTAAVNNVDWSSPAATLQYTGPILQALSSGLAKVPVYSQMVYRLDTIPGVLNQPLKTRQNYIAKNYKVGTVLTQNYPMSTAKSLNSQYITTNYNLANFGVVFEIDQIKSGHDIQFVSDKVREEEVLFAPGSRIQIISVTPHKPGDPTDTHIWVKAIEV